MNDCPTFKVDYSDKATATRITWPNKKWSFEECPPKVTYIESWYRGNRVTLDHDEISNVEISDYRPFRNEWDAIVLLFSVTFQVPDFKLKKEFKKALRESDNTVYVSLGFMRPTGIVTFGDVKASQRVPLVLVK